MKTGIFKQHNLCVSLLKKEQKQGFANLNKKISPITENFGILLNHFFFEQIKSRDSIVLIEKGKIISNTNT